MTGPAEREAEASSAGRPTPPPSRRARFLAEQRTLASLEHPSIARLYDADSLPDGTPWFAMEYVEGVSLTDYCRERGTSLEGRLLLLRSVCEAVRHAHRHLVVHRDLKPSNVFYTTDGQWKVLDFGVSKAISDFADAGPRTMAQRVAARRPDLAGAFGRIARLYIRLRYAARQHPRDRESLHREVRRFRP